MSNNDYIFKRRGLIKQCPYKLKKYNEKIYEFVKQFHMFSWCKFEALELFYSILIWKGTKLMNEKHGA